MNFRKHMCRLLAVSVLAGGFALPRPALAQVGATGPDDMAKLSFEALTAPPRPAPRPAPPPHRWSAREDDDAPPARRIRHHVEADPDVHDRRAHPGHRIGSPERGSRTFGHASAGHSAQHAAGHTASHFVSHAATGHSARHRH